MKRAEKAIYLIGGLVLIAMLLFPPWLYVGSTPFRSAGYHVLWDGWQHYGRVRVNTTQLFIQEAVVTVVTCFWSLVVRK